MGLPVKQLRPAERRFYLRFVRHDASRPLDLHYLPQSAEPPEFVLALPRSENGFTCRVYQRVHCVESWGNWENGPAPIICATYAELRDGAGVHVDPKCVVSDVLLGEWKGA